LWPYNAKIANLNLKNDNFEGLSQTDTAEFDREVMSQLLMKITNLESKV